MRRAGPALVTPLDTLLEMRRGSLLPLPSQLLRLYGRLRMRRPGSRPYLFSNFVTTLDGVVSFNIKGHASGGDISGFSAQDRMVMGLLRAVADVVIIGSGTLGADSRHVWTAEAIFPELASEYRRLRATLGKREPLLNVIVSGSGVVDLSLPVFASGKVQALLVTTSAGAKRLRRQRAPHSVEIRATGRRTGPIAPRDILAEVSRMGAGKLVLIEGGPRLLGDFYAERLLDEQFLTLAPQVAGRNAGDQRLSLVMGKAFKPGASRWGNLIDARSGDSLLFLRYAFSDSRRGKRTSGRR